MRIARFGMLKTQGSEGGGLSRSNSAKILGTLRLVAIGFRLPACTNEWAVSRRSTGES